MSPPAGRNSFEPHCPQSKSASSSACYPVKSPLPGVWSHVALTPWGIGEGTAPSINPASHLYLPSDAGQRITSLVVAGISPIPIYHQPIQCQIVCPLIALHCKGKRTAFLVPSNRNDTTKTKCPSYCNGLFPHKRGALSTTRCSFLRILNRTGSPDLIASRSCRKARYHHR